MTMTIADPQPGSKHRIAEFSDASLSNLVVAYDKTRILAAIDRFVRGGKPSMRNCGDALSSKP
jgi:hypothetical protein